jgi:hypothetical protein
MQRISLRILIGAFISLFLGVFILSCAMVTPRSSPADRDRRQPHPGRDLARQHCGTCHPVPKPDQLPRETWPFVLDWMGNYLGYPMTDGRLDNLVDEKLIPAEPTIGDQELKALRDFFTSGASPGPLRPADKPPMQTGLRFFEPVERNLLPVKNAYITSVKIDQQANRLFVGYGDENMLVRYDATGDRISTAGGITFDTQPVGVATSEDTVYVTLIGDLMRGRNKGQVVRLRPWKGKIEATHLIQGYHRTSHALLHDLDGDGRQDIIVSGFGDFGEGRLAWFENLGGHQNGTHRYREHILWNRDGALKTAVHDFTGNGRPDIMTLIAQERQELLLYRNQGNGAFERTQILRKFPGFGVNSFELADFNDDGLMDILLINGNNMEFPDPPLRDYHGLRILLNQGDLEFKEAYFYPMYGAIGARVADFTGNGLLDIAAISLFPDWSADQPESFVFLRQRTSMEFTPVTHPATQGARWLSIDAGDLDGNGTTDLVLGEGGFLHGIPEALHHSFLARSKETPPVLILKNVGEHE